MKLVQELWRLRKRIKRQYVRNGWTFNDWMQAGIYQWLVRCECQEIGLDESPVFSAEAIVGKQKEPILLQTYEKP